ncbi:hypothetical protein BC829DRAFT_471928 [Chytridium lagenaria]|nr:hypothetical protein BC829DRAFT_471928 [Chytridium lagenaria]
MTDLHHQLHQLKLLMLHEQIQKDIQSKHQQAPSPSQNLVSNPTLNAPIESPNATQPQHQNLAFEAYRSELEKLSTKVDALTTNIHKETQIQWNAEDMYRTIMMQNAQVQGLLMQNVLGGTGTFMLGAPNAAGKTAPASVPTPNPTTKKPLKTFKMRRIRSRLHTIFFCATLKVSGRHFRKEPKNVDRIMQMSQDELCTFFKERKTFFDAVEMISRTSKEGTALIHVVGGEGWLVNENGSDGLWTCGGDVNKNHHSTTTHGRHHHRRPSHAPELRNFLQKDPLHIHRTTKKYKLSILLYLFISKTLIGNMLMRPIDSLIIKRLFPLLELNLLCVAYVLNMVMVKSCGFAVEEHCREFLGRVPVSLKVVKMNGTLAHQIEQWTFAVENWIKGVLAFIEKDAMMNIIKRT